MGDEIIENFYRTYPQKKVFRSNLGVGPGFQILDTLLYA
jgi:hypothetical protein